MIDRDNRCGTMRILVLGVGNMLLKDEGIGVHVAERLQEQTLAENIEVIDGGTSGLDTLLLEQPPYKLVVVDAIRAGGKPGTIYKTRLTEGEYGQLRESLGRDERVSLHQVGLIDALGVAEKLHCAPEEMVIIGIEPGQVSCGLELTAAVRRSVPAVIKEVLKEINNVIHRE